MSDREKKKKDAREIMEDFHNHMNGYSQEEIKEMTRGSKQLHELLFVENFIVKNAITSSEILSTLNGEPCFGPSGNPSHMTGLIFKTTLDVEPLSEIPVRRLEFPSITPARADDLIAATIPRYERKTIRVKGIGNCYDKGDRPFYFDRKYNLSEDAIRIDILSGKAPNAKTLRSDRSPGYADFVKK